MKKNILGLVIGLPALYSVFIIINQNLRFSEKGTNIFICLGESQTNSDCLEPFWLVRAYDLGYIFIFIFFAYIILFMLLPVFFKE
jgi:hypothetical protein